MINFTSVPVEKRRRLAPERESRRPGVLPDRARPPGGRGQASAPVAQHLTAAALVGGSVGEPPTPATGEGPAQYTGRCRFGLEERAPAQTSGSPTSAWGMSWGCPGRHVELTLFPEARVKGPRPQPRWVDKGQSSGSGLDWAAPRPHGFGTRGLRSRAGVGGSSRPLRVKGLS